MKTPDGGVALVVGAFVAPLLLVVVCFLRMDGASAASPCGSPASVVDAAARPKTVGVFSGKQLENSVTIMAAAKSMCLPVAAQILGVQAGIGESTLNILTDGDAVGSDSRGQFQQLDNGVWGRL